MYPLFAGTQDWVRSLSLTILAHNKFVNSSMIDHGKYRNPLDSELRHWEI